MRKNSNMRPSKRTIRVNLPHIPATVEIGPKADPEFVLAFLGELQPQAWAEHLATAKSEIRRTS